MQVRQLIQACEPSQTAQPSPADRAPAPDAPMHLDSTGLPLDSDEAAASRVGNGTSSTAEASFAGLLIAKLAVRGHARLVARALWQAMRPHVVPNSSGADMHIDAARDASSSLGAAPRAVTWGAAASLGPAGAYASAAPLELGASCDALRFIQAHSSRACGDRMPALQCSVMDCHDAIWQVNRLLC